MNPLVSIITVVYNGAETLQQTIDSVSNQTYSNIEYIVIDGGSTDDTIALIKKNNDKITKWISEPDEGLYDAMNKGISMASGQLIGMINSDDWYEMDAVGTVVDEYRNHPEISVFHSDTFYVSHEGDRSIRKFNPSEFKFKYSAMTYSHPTFFVSQGEYRLHKYNGSLRSLADYQFILETYLRDKHSIYYIDKPLVNFRVDGISGSLPFFKSLQEGFSSRKQAGLSVSECVFSLCIRFILTLLYRAKIKIIG